MQDILERKTELEEKREDADELIRKVIKKVPEQKKVELLKLVEGFAICAESMEKGCQQKGE